MSHKSKIVIVIPAFNAEKYLKRSIESCLNQTVSTEIWVVDNCSDDKTVVASYAGGADRGLFGLTSVLSSYG